MSGAPREAYGAFAYTAMPGWVSANARIWLPARTSASAWYSGLIAPGHSFAVLTQRHMHLYGTKREHFAEIAISQRNNAIRRPTYSA